MIRIWLILVMLAMGSSDTRISGNLTAYCPSYENCTRGESYGGYGYYTLTTDYAVNGQCYPQSNISLYTLEIMPNDNVMVSCIYAYNGTVSYTVVYRVSEDRIGVDSWINGMQQSRILQVSIAR